MIPTLCIVDQLVKNNVSSEGVFYEVHLQLFLSFSHCFLVSPGLTPTKQLVPYQLSLSFVINLSVKIFLFPGLQDVFSWDPATAPPPFFLPTRIIKLSRSVIRHPKREKRAGLVGGVGVGGEGGVSRVTAQNRLSRTRLAQQWGGVSKPLNLEDDKWHLK